ncbi:MAG: DUF2752 domain-containing protein [Spirochaetia bacterium]|nr:DUF2752 domain-containing protein [Spirochaetia bacterium]
MLERIKAITRMLPCLDPRTSSELRFFQTGSLLMFVLAFVIPEHGTGTSYCIFYNLVGFPCPGCGLTRAVANVAHGSFLESIRYHPGGIPVVLMGFVFGVSAFVPRFSSFLDRNRSPLIAMIMAGSIVLLIYGSARIVWGVTGSEEGFFHLLKSDKRFAGQVIESAAHVVRDW